jgi:hypothetical protein
MENTFLTKRSQFFQKTIWPQVAEKTNVAGTAPRKSVGFLYRKRTQFQTRQKAEG